METKLVNDKRCLSIVNWLTPNVVSQSSIVNCKLYIGFRRMLFLLLLSAILAGCEKNTPGEDDPNKPVNVVMQDVVLQGIVKDANDAPLGDVKVTTGSLSATTNNYGTFSFTQAGTVNNRAVIKFEKNGYFTLTRSGENDGEMYIEVLMYPKSNSAISLQVDFDASQPKTLEKGGLKIELPAACFVNSDGKPYSGTVHADILYLAAGNPNLRKLIPGGDLSTTDKDVMMLPAGIADVNFSDAAGKPLKIADKMNATVTCALPADMDVAKLPASLPGWTFDEARGLWREEGTATLSGRAYTGAVAHFSPYGIGDGFDMYYATVLQVQATTCDDKPAAGAAITFEHSWDGEALGLLVRFWSDGVFYTESNGFCAVFVPQSDDVKITGTYQGQTRTANVKAAATTTGTPLVELKFDDNCGNGADLVFNLKIGQDKNSFIIECNPAMPAYNNNPYSPKEYIGKRIPPNIFLKYDGKSCLITSRYKNKDGLYIPTGGLIYSGCDGMPLANTIYVSENSNWNANYTEYTYNLIYDAKKGEIWRGQVQLGPPDTDQLQIASYFKMIDIKSITIGMNKPVFLEVVAQ